MPKFRFKLQVTVTTTDIVLEAKNRQDLNDRVDALDVGEVLRKCADGMRLTYKDQGDGGIQRVFDAVPETFPRKEGEKSEVEKAAMTLLEATRAEIRKEDASHREG